MSCMLGIDIGFTHTGWVAATPTGQGNYEIVRLGCIVTVPIGKKGAVRVADSDVERCKTIYRELMRIIWRENVHGLVFEVPHGGAQSARAARALGLATGILACVAEQAGGEGMLPSEYVTPQANKREFCGRNNASKEQMIARAVELWPSAPPWPRAKGQLEHVADAAGCLYAVRNGDLYRRLAMMETKGERA